MPKGSLKMGYALFWRYLVFRLLFSMQSILQKAA